MAHGVDLAMVVGTGRGGRVCAADVRAMVQPPGRSVSRSPDRPASASPTLPVATALVEFDAGAALGKAAALRAPVGRTPLPVGLTALVVEAAAGLLAAFPELNGAWGGAVAVRRRRVHVAVGEAGTAGLAWRVVPDAGDLSARGVARALAGGAEGGGGATFAVLSLVAGASWQSAAPPLAGTAAALSVGAPALRVVAHNDGIAVRPVATLTLSYDARLVDHCRAAAFLQALRIRLESR